MLSLSVANQQVRFRTRKNETVTVLPVTVEFEKLSRAEKKSTMVNHVEWRKVTASDFGSKGCMLFLTISRLHFIQFS
ncbi:hypothetical protein TNCT_284381 [Trichonephila clavata]|uniref:Uncharacterized protein n=1 Tax=Trichonephila clavata TaxID=2740835 RepID=A0A8X6LMJ0_TRICU|nr:hypothetical protein TNCT_284381 [Trichonephila clavata]